MKNWKACKENEATLETAFQMFKSKCLRNANQKISREILAFNIKLFLVMHKKPQSPLPPTQIGLSFTKLALILQG